MAPSKRVVLLALFVSGALGGFLYLVAAGEYSPAVTTAQASRVPRPKTVAPVLGPVAGALDLAGAVDRAPPPAPSLDGSEALVDEPEPTLPARGGPAITGEELFTAYRDGLCECRSRACVAEQNQRYLAMVPDVVGGFAPPAEALRRELRRCLERAWGSPPRRTREERRREDEELARLGAEQGGAASSE